MRPRQHAFHQARARRVLYFDIDGTLVRPALGSAKRALARGRFERAVRDAGFDLLVCVSSACDEEAGARRMRDACERWRRAFHLCRGTFEDLAWFRRRVRALGTPRLAVPRGERAAEDYHLYARGVPPAGRPDLAAARREGRLLECDPRGEGADVLAWLRSVQSRNRAAQSSSRGPPSASSYERILV